MYIMQTNNESSKMISFEGINNRYKIKKLVDSSSTCKIKKDAEKWKFTQNAYSEDMQNVFLKEIIDESNLSTESITVKREVEKKIQGYKQQDIVKSRFSIKDFIDFDFVIHELYKSNISCYYCSKSVFLLYEHVRETNQWTLDRIDNSIGHNRGNVVVSCLKCNLKRRKTSQDAFIFTKNLQIVKSTNDAPC